MVYRVGCLLSSLFSFVLICFIVVGCLFCLLCGGQFCNSNCDLVMVV